MIFWYFILAACIFELLWCIVTYARKPDAKFNKLVEQRAWVIVCACFLSLFGFLLFPHKKVMEKHLVVTDSEVDTLGHYIITKEFLEATTNKKELAKWFGEGESFSTNVVRIFNTKDSTEIVVDKTSAKTKTELISP